MCVLLSPIRFRFGRTRGQGLSRAMVATASALGRRVTFPVARPACRWWTVGGTAWPTASPTF